MSTVEPQRQSGAADAEAFASVGRRFLQLPISSVRTLGATELAGLALAT